MDDYEIFEISPDDIMRAMGKNIKEDIKDFEDLINLDGSLSREIYLGDIVNGTGTNIDGLIRFWNNYDERKNIPIEERKPIKIYIDSYGGSLTDSFTIIDSIKMSKTPVWTICTGCAYSGGFFVATVGHRRFAYPRASFLFHEGATGSSGTASQFENYSAFYKRQIAQLKDIVLKNTKISSDEYKDIKKDDVWYTADEAVEKGIVDKIIEELI